MPDRVSSMSATPATQSVPAPIPPLSGTVWGATFLRAALRRFELLLSVALAISVLVLVEDYLTWSGIATMNMPAGPRPFAEWWTIGLGVGLQVALGLSIAMLVIIGIVLAVTGMVSWRRGVLTMDRASFEFGPAQVEAARKARSDHSLTLWLFLIYVLAAIAVSVVIAALNATLTGASVDRVPEAIASVVTGLATSSVLVLIYYFGSRHLVGLLFAVSAPDGQALLVRGRNLMVAGAIVGVGVSFAPLAWPFDVLAVASLAIILAGVRDLLRSYDLWLAGKRSGTLPIRGPLGVPA